MASRKIQPNGIEPGGSQFGTTFCHSEPAKFRNTGANQKKKGSGGDTIKSGPSGTTFQSEPRFPAPLPNADKRPKADKEVATSKTDLDTKEFETTGEQTASKSGSEGPSQRKYPLARDYDKSGKTDRKSHRLY